ncbi:DNA adenine methylase [uncultured Brachyspira sp.]|uniref:DNA adenine methylase n=1 Tax=uncultured Brachyspira sp. TaxID=221953 RepID=UPI002603221A|nr:DNA adenine methylase [uncultured Brachyspira sp.]
MIYNIWNRRYTGSKYKLSNWIKELIINNCYGDSFCDLFAGTGIISYKMLEQYKTIHLNDILFSNELIYKAFFYNAEYDINKLIYTKNYFNNIEINDDNYISNNFGNKFFSVNDSRKIGYIREYLEINRNDFSDKEYYILLASLIYSFDKIANTVGHYDAYIKNKEIKDKFEFNLIKPYNTNMNNIIISRKYANELVTTTNEDIIYIDPPYNSRQYSRFYHILENITMWKKPKLFGTALKPAPENMSNYCRNSAKKEFNDLIEKLNCKYIIVSYNNTYNSKSKSSENKILYNDIINILNNKGKVKIFDIDYKFFNAGKTNFTNHKEFIFLVKVF